MLSLCMHWSRITVPWVCMVEQDCREMLYLQHRSHLDLPVVVFSHICGLSLVCSPWAPWAIKDNKAFVEGSFQTPPADASVEYISVAKPWICITVTFLQHASKTTWHAIWWVCRVTVAVILVVWYKWPAAGMSTSGPGPVCRGQSLGTKCWWLHLPSEADYAIQRFAVIAEIDCDTSTVGLHTVTQVHWHIQLDCGCSAHGLPCIWGHCNKSAVDLVISTYNDLQSNTMQGRHPCSQILREKACCKTSILKWQWGSPVQADKQASHQQHLFWYSIDAFSTI